MALVASSTAFVGPEPSIVSFAGISSGLSTDVDAMNDLGDVTGVESYCCAEFSAYVRYVDGQTSIPSAPGAYRGNFPTAINNHGAVTGHQSTFRADGSTGGDGFIWFPDRSPIVLVVPVSERPVPEGAEAEEMEYSLAAHDVNNAGVVVGSYSVTGRGTHGFVANLDGVITTVDVPGASSTVLQSVNDQGNMIGSFVDERGTHQFVADSYDLASNALENVTTISVGPGSATQLAGINATGDVVGSYIDRTGSRAGFISSGQGDLVVFTVPGSASTEPAGINDSGTTAGTYQDDLDGYHGFIRYPNGTIITFDAPDAESGPDSGTTVRALNNAGQVAGSYDTDYEVAERFDLGFIRSGIDEVDGLTMCDVLGVTVDLGAGDQPTDGPDVIAGTSGDDTIAARGGDDIVCGGGGNDTIWGQSGNDVIYGGDGDDKLRGGGGNDTIEGGNGADDLAGGGGDDLVDGGDGDDTLVRGGTGNDWVNGASGNDQQLSGNGGEDTVHGGSGDDKLTGGPRPDTLYGGPGNDLLRGLNGADRLHGEAGNDQLSGGPSPDILDGGDGTDSCNGGTTVNGGTEADTSNNCETATNIP